ncbi:MAG: hypothetical protein DMG32_21195 [Acidobacteria bacterium]|nr:MAG: hypothetical protein DMG32_21195 [Acidobacteriota bacterium]
MVLLGAGLAAQLFSAALPKDVQDCLKRDVVPRRLIDGICRRCFPAERVELGVFSRFAFRARMRGSLAEGVPYAIRLAMMPSEFDRGRHARFLEPLYLSGARCAWRGSMAGARVPALSVASNTNPKSCAILLQN